jgi:RNA polymerase sporulation-specific sigma factor
VKSAGREKNKPLNNYVSLLDADVYLTCHDPLEEMIDRENGEEFFRRMNEVLSDLEFRVLMLYIKGLSTAEICKITKKNEKCVDNALQRSRKKLQQIVQEKNG